MTKDLLRAYNVHCPFTNATECWQLRLAPDRFKRLNPSDDIHFVHDLLEAKYELLSYGSYIIFQHILFKFL